MPADTTVSEILGKLLSEVNWENVRLTTEYDQITVFGASLRPAPGVRASNRGRLVQLLESEGSGEESELLVPEIAIEQHRRLAGNFPDLIELERYLVALASGTLLFAESEGAIAELGAFSMEDEFRRDLIVSYDPEEYKPDGFIRLGPIRRVERMQESKTVQLGEGVTGLRPSDQDILEAWRSARGSARAQSGKSRKYNPNALKDALEFVLGVLKEFPALRHREIIDLCKAMPDSPFGSNAARVLAAIQMGRRAVVIEYSKTPHYFAVRKTSQIEWSLKKKNLLDALVDEYISDHLMMDPKRGKAYKTFNEDYGSERSSGKAQR